MRRRLMAAAAKPVPNPAPKPASKPKKPLPPKRKPAGRPKIDPKQVLLATKLQRELEKRGSVTFAPESGTLSIDAEYLRLPADITALPAHELGRHLSAFTQHKMYMRTLHFRMQCHVEDIRRGYDAARREAFMEHKGCRSVTERDFLVNSDPRVAPSHDLWTETKMKAAMVKDTIESISDAIFLISREISRREADFPHERREHSAGRPI